MIEDVKDVKTTLTSVSKVSKGKFVIISDFLNSIKN